MARTEKRDILEITCKTLLMQVSHQYYTKVEGTQVNSLVSDISEVKLVHLALYLPPSHVNTAIRRPSELCSPMTISVSFKRGISMGVSPCGTARILTETRTSTTCFQALKFISSENASAYIH